MAAMVPERSRTLHNFSLPPRLNWGTQRLLRCAKLNNTTSSSNDTVSDSADRKRRNPSFRLPPPPPSIHRRGNEIEVIKEKLILQVDKIHSVYLSNSEFTPPLPLPESRPWNLRTRRSPATAEFPPPEACASGGVGGSGSGNGGRAKFSVPLSRQEIEDDFVEMIGRRPPRKPKKRPRYVQKQLDTLFPGLWLSEVSPEMYKVNETPEPPPK